MFRGRADKGVSGGRQVRLASKLYHRRALAEKGLDIGKVLTNGDLVALSFILLVPLVMIMEDQRDDIVEIVDELVWCGRVY